MVNVECPECKTTYRPQSLGFTPDADGPSVCTVKCVVCKSTFDAEITPVVTQPSLIGRLRGRTAEVSFRVTVKMRTRGGG